jgi:hypothetical protein
LLIRLQALSQLTDRNSTLNWARWLLFALFTVIECLPIVVKTLLNLGPRTAYEAIQADQEQMHLEVSRDETAKNERISRIEADSRLTETQRLADDRQSMIEQVTQRAVAAEEKVALAWIDDWERRQLRLVGKGTVPTGAAPRFSPVSRFRNRWVGAGDGTAPRPAAGGTEDEPDSDLGNGYPPGNWDQPGNGDQPANGYRPAGDGYQDARQDNGWGNGAASELETYVPYSAEQEMPPMEFPTE